jgi:hypothetical protein
MQSDAVLPYSVSVLISPYLGQSWAGEGADLCRRTVEFQKLRPCHFSLFLFCRSGVNMGPDTGCGRVCVGSTGRSGRWPRRERWLCGGVIDVAP